ncbi:SGNH/GDSL hydrolase family protein [Anaerosalibacter bizertensis]|uniref:SGNH/GDSL hydrolase family protein n=1 Tax=Anaerosalibacter bizertensis TaxID=932217 RepID=A0A9Q4AAJ9_9FIRM|nr:SGNH/GDSL hydrolase family protein [Anaerosalibacter bizertensis]MBV1819694.1 SGNH/GDSL hydrolase family protein [Bacteroidales bacterium MSK.15.36]MCB5558736.1 SGNH/GDSL hydrolase family protein [Anaerosalibacter bizertensis]MCG4564106.1 SGNH/GDSL hydrolase family protein [Anaerosalibacter bizertensis]MCG4582349.1 SGNH/GDSL hydrolase family protein [Anaerosalibacter bizertensis]
MKTILCYGDSNTWGYNPDGTGRYPKDIRWTSVLENELGNGYEIIAEGLNGRTTVWNDPVRGEYRNGKTYLSPCLHTHKPIDLVILFLGSNDLKSRFSVNSYEIAQSIEMLINIIKKSETGPNMVSPEILVIIPPPILIPAEVREAEYLIPEFEKAIEKSKQFSKEFNRLLSGQCHLLDSSKLIKTSEIDGMHLDPESHKILGKAVAKYIRDHIF